MVKNELKECFKLNTKELNSVLSIKNKDKYIGWYGIFCPEKMRRLRAFHLSMLCVDWEYYNLEIDRKQLKKEVLNGQSIFKMLHEDPINKEKILFAGARLNLGHITKDNLIKRF